jgi:hypothetical protein
VDRCISGGRPSKSADPKLLVLPTTIWGLTFPQTAHFTSSLYLAVIYGIEPLRLVVVKDASSPVLTNMTRRKNLASSRAQIGWGERCPLSNQLEASSWGGVDDKLWFGELDES